MAWPIWSYGGALYLAALTACGSSRTVGVVDGSLDGETSDAHDDGLLVPRTGFVLLVSGGGTLHTSAAIRDRPELPAPVLIAQREECAVYRRPAPSCDPPCIDGVCITIDTCAPLAQHVSVGPITIEGLYAPLAFQEGPFGYVPVPQPSTELFAAGTTITVSARGNAVPAFRTTVTGPSSLTAPFQNVTLVDGVDTTLTWTAGGAGRDSIQIMLRVGWHGAPDEAFLLCETDDDGSHTIPGFLIAELPRPSSDLEPHGSWIMRFDRTIVPSDAGPIEVIAASGVAVHFAHP